MLVLASAASWDGSSRSQAAVDLSVCTDGSAAAAARSGLAPSECSCHLQTSTLSRRANPLSWHPVSDGLVARTRTGTSRWLAPRLVLPIVHPRQLWREPADG